MKGFIKRSLTSSCCTFTILLFIFYIFGYLASTAKLPAMTFKMVASLFIASYVICLSSGLLTVKKIPVAVTYVAHFICCVGSFLLLYTNVMGKAATGSGKIVCLALSSVIYFAVMLIRYAIISVSEKLKENK